MQREMSPGEKTRKLEMGPPYTEVEQTDKDTAPVLDTPGDFHEQPDAHGHRHHADSLAESTQELESDVTQHAEKTVSLETKSEAQPPPGWVPWKTAGPDGVVRVDRDAVIAEFGNTPKVNAYLELARKVHTTDSYTQREIYEYMVLDKEFTQNPNILPSQIETLKRIAAQNPDAVLPSWRSLKNNPNFTIRIRNGTE